MFYFDFLFSTEMIVQMSLPPSDVMNPQV